MILLGLGIIYYLLFEILLIKIIGIINIVVSSMIIILFMCQLMYYKIKKKEIVTSCCDYFQQCQQNTCCHAFIFFGTGAVIILTLGAIVGILTNSYLWSLLFELTGITMIYWSIRLCGKSCVNHKIYPIVKNDHKIVGIVDLINSNA